ncbi:MAG: hypothetical protein WBE72_12825 [Terracidiphilus sp.]
MKPRRTATCPLAFFCLAVLACLAAPAGFLHAQAGTAITIRMFDARTARALIPNNLLVRVDHQDDIHSETLRIDDQGVGTVTVPAGATVLSVQGTYNDGMEIYINCDAGMEKNLNALHWYSIAAVVSTGVIAPNECYRGKYERDPRIPLKPGEFDFFVRKTNVRDQLAN